MNQKRKGNIASLLSGIFFLALAGVLFFVSFTLREDAQGREIQVTLGDLYERKIGPGDYITVKDTGVVISAVADVTDDLGNPLGRAFILNGIPNYIFLVGIAEQFTDTSGTLAIPLNPGSLIPVAFKGRVNTAGEAVPYGMETFAVSNGLSTGDEVYAVQTGVTKADTSVPFYITLVFGALALLFSAASWISLVKKK